VSKESPTPEFWERADAVIDLANQQCRDAPRSQVSASLLYAAARFNAYVAALGASGPQELKAER
jgi:hypothetical protein